MIRISRYGESVGVLTLKVGGYEKELKPKVGDGREFLKMVARADKSKDVLFDQFAEYMYRLICRVDKPNNPEEDDELKLYIDRNLMELLNEIMIAFKLTTREEIENQKKNLLSMSSDVTKG